MKFKTRDIHMQSLGEALRVGREQAGLSLTEAAAAVQIRESILTALEAGNRIALPPPVYLRGLVRALARRYGVDDRVLLVMLEKEYYPQPKPKREKSVRNIFRPPIILITPKRLLLGGLSLLLLVSATYLLLQIYSLAKPPTLVVIEPGGDREQPDAVLNVRGRSEAHAQVDINGEAVFVDERGNFQHELLLLPGLHIIRITARNVFGKETTVTRTIVIRSE